MFYARGDDHFELANVYECHNVASNILASVWGKRQNYQGYEPAAQWQFKLTSPGTGVPWSPKNGSWLSITDAYGITVKFVFSTQAVTAPTFMNFVGPAWDSLNPTQPIEITVYTMGFPSSPFDSHDNLNDAINWANTNPGTLGTPWSITSAPPPSLVLGEAPYTTITSVVSSDSVNQVVIADGTGVAQTSTQLILTTLATGSPPTPPPYNTSRVINYNRLGGRPDDPSGVDMAYGYATDLQRTFFAQFEVMGNLEKDLCVKRNCWSLCSRLSIEDQLYGLAFVAEDCDDVCMKVSCARKWSEVEDALAESCLAENNTIGYGDIVDLYINVRVTNAHPKAMDTIIRIRFPVQLTRGPDDLGNWNVVASDAADAVLTTGIPYDSVEGGNMQYANASSTEINPASNNQQQTQLPTSTAPANSNNSTDPHDGVPLS
jgi:hypothetical protein